MFDTLGTWATAFAIIVTIVWAVKDRKVKIWKSQIGKIAIGFWVITIIFAGFANEFPSKKSKQEQIRTEQQKADKKKASRVSSEKAASQSSKKAANSSAKAVEAKQLKVTRKKNEQQHYKEFQTFLMNIPGKTKNAITDSYYSKKDSTTYITVNSAILSGTDAELKQAVRGAWNIGQNAYNKFSPMADDINGNNVTVKDQAGNDLAHTSMFGSFKYDGE